MRIHLEVAVAPDWLPLAPWTGAMMGGTEALAVRLARGLAARGHAVTFRGGLLAGTDHGVRYLAPSESGPADRLICVNAAAPNDWQSDASVFWSHAAQLPVHGTWNKIVAVSEYHATLLRSRLPGAPVTALPAAADLAIGSVDVEPDRFLYASSPDRGLHRLLHVWPALWQRFRRPLSITYDLRAVFRRRLGTPDAVGARLRAIAPMLEQPGVVVHGPLVAEELGELRSLSLALLYPLDPVIPHSELYALSVLDAAAAGVPLLLSPVDCFPTEYRDAARFVHGYAPEDWADALVEVLSDRASWSERGRRLAAHTSAEQWLDSWEALLSDPGGACEIGPAGPAPARPAPPAPPVWRPPRLTV